MSSNAIQLARCAGYRVIATASPRNFGYVRSLGAAAAVDYHSRTAADKIVDALGDSPLAGTLAIGSGSVPAALSITARAHGRRRIAAAQPQLITRLQTAFRPHRGIHVSGIWGGTLKDNEVGPGIYADFLPPLSPAGYTGPPRRQWSPGKDSSRFRPPSTSFAKESPRRSLSSGCDRVRVKAESPQLGDGLVTPASRRLLPATDQGMSR